MRTLLAAILVIFLAGCATPHDRQRLGNALYWMGQSVTAAQQQRYNQHMPQYVAPQGMRCHNVAGSVRCYTW